MSVKISNQVTYRGKRALSDCMEGQQGQIMMHNMAVKINYTAQVFIFHLQRLKKINKC